MHPKAQSFKFESKHTNPTTTSPRPLELLLGCPHLACHRWARGSLHTCPDTPGRVLDYTQISRHPVALAANLGRRPLGGSVAPNLAAAAAAPAPIGARRILEFWECLTPPVHTPPPAAGLSPEGSRAARSPPGVDLLLAPSPLPAESTLQGPGFCFCFFCWSKRQVLGSGCSHGLACLCSEIPKRNLRDEGVLIFQEPVSCFPRHPLIVLAPPDVWLASTRTSSPRYTSRDSPKPSRKCPGADSGGCRIRCSRLHHQPHLPQFKPRPMGPGLRRDLRGWVWGLTSAAKSPHPQL